MITKQQQQHQQSNGSDSNNMEYQNKPLPSFQK